MLPRVLSIHNQYRWPGGEDRVVQAEATLLQRYGHEVHLAIAKNQSILEKGRWHLVWALLNSAWSFRSFFEIQQRIGSFQPDLLHLHNFWFVWTPSVLAAARKEGCATVMTLHNMRLLCPSGTFLDPRGFFCNRCVGTFPWRGLFQRCYHRSFLATAAIMWLIFFHQLRKTWQRDVDLFLAPSRFVKESYTKGGFPAERIFVKPHFVEWPQKKREQSVTSRRLLFLGRWSEEKGVIPLLEAWEKFIQRVKLNLELRLVGSGPLETLLRERLKEPDLARTVTLVEQQGQEIVEEELSTASLLVVPSLCGETFGLTIIEAAARGLPSVGSAIGAIPELIHDGVTGLLVPPGNSDALANALYNLMTRPERREEMGRAARRRYEIEFTPECNYRLLLEAYQVAIENQMRNPRRE